MAGVAWRKPKENSIAALEYGMEHADGVEMDLRLTAEGEVVIHHAVSYTHLTLPTILLV